MNPLPQPTGSDRSSPRSSRRFGAGIALALTALLATACGGSDDAAEPAGSAPAASDPAASDPALSGIVRDPAPQVDLVSLPSLSEPGEDVEFRADEGEIQVVYFGFTNCPDVCPTTMADLAVALRLMDDELADDVDVVMATVDPDRDLDLLEGYVTSFVPDATAIGTEDTELLEAAGEPFGASWEVREIDDGSIEVDHSPFLYAVDDQGKLVLTWQFGASPQDMADDLTTLLTREQA
ncbi:SCO family protein [Ilumatobacter sp.]|uniref:SCO family protein n=1 Tax=Ilumatobacter sp. TaxID=1967498 RepID=UPI003C4B6180